MWKPRMTEVAEVVTKENEAPCLPKALLKFKNDLDQFESQVKEAKFIQSRLHVMIAELEELILKK